MTDMRTVRSLADITGIQARIAPDAPALSCGDRHLSFAELDLSSRRTAGALLKHPGAPGPRVAILARNGIPFVEVMHATFQAGGVFIPLNWRLAPPELAVILGDSDATILLAEREFLGPLLPLLRDCPNLARTIVLDGAHEAAIPYDDWRDAVEPLAAPLPRPADDDILQLYTSGTTGLPKGVRISDRAMAASRREVLASWGDWRAGETALLVLPNFHIAGMLKILLAGLAGCRLVLMPGFDPRAVLEAIDQYRVNMMPSTPPMLRRLVEAANEHPGVDLSSLRQITYGAAPISAELQVQVRALFGCALIQNYGLTETLGHATTLPAEDHDPALGRLQSAGKAGPFSRLRAIDPDGRDCPPGTVGQIIIKPPALMTGYWKRADDTAAAIRDGWFHSGDAGYIDEDGYCFLTDRLKDMIVTGGENVYPTEVEHAILLHRAVRDAAVIGIPDPRWGEAILALVVYDADEPVPPDELIAFLRGHIAGYKLPKRVEAIDSIPRSPAGKILRRELRARYWGEGSRLIG